MRSLKLFNNFALIFCEQKDKKKIFRNKELKNFSSQIAVTAGEYSKKKHFKRLHITLLNTQMYTIQKTCQLNLTD